jgi:hypothetical protein
VRDRAYLVGSVRRYQHAWCCVGDAAMTNLGWIALVGTAAAALALASLGLVAWDGSIFDDTGPLGQNSIETSQRTPPSPPRPAISSRSGVHWPMAKVMRAIDGVRIRAGSRVVRVQAETTLCSGEEPPVRRKATRSWERFRCTFTSFRASVPERDLEFRVHPLGPRRFSISGARWIGG